METNDIGRFLTIGFQIASTGAAFFGEYAMAAMLTSWAIIVYITCVLD